MASKPEVIKELADNEFLFTSECVNEGHPDKLCDLISDSVLDAYMKQDPNSIVSCEVIFKTNTVILLGTITSKAKVNFEQIVRYTCKQVGYDAVEKGLDYAKCNVVVSVDIKRPVDSLAVEEEKIVEQQRNFSEKTVFGFACNDTECKMPLTHYFATQLGHRLMTAGKQNILPWVRPGGKTQVTCVYQKDSNGFILPVRVHTVLISAKHSGNISNEQLVADLKQHVIMPVLGKWYNDKIAFHLNTSGRFVIGGYKGVAGLSGRKVIVDTYGGWGGHGGTPLSGKDPSSGSRSVAYAARWIAKSLVCAGLCDRVMVQLSYSSVGPYPRSVIVNSFGTSKKDDNKLTKIIIKNFDLRPESICRELDLLKPVFSKTCSYGHFGKEGEGFEWEKPKKLEV